MPLGGTWPSYMRIAIDGDHLYIPTARVDGLSLHTSPHFSRLRAPTTTEPATQELALFFRDVFLRELSPLQEQCSRKGDELI